MGGVFGFFLGVTILNLLRQTWIYIATVSHIKDTLASEKVNFRCHESNKRGLQFY